MKKDEKSLIFTFLGIIVLCLFSGILIFNIKKENNNTYYSRTSDNDYNDVQLFKQSNDLIKISVNPNVIKYCIKSTQSKPQASDLCWKEN